MAFIQTKVIREALDAERRVKELRLDMGKLLKARNVARSSSANATPFHPLNAGGTFAYQDGSWAIRNEFVDGAVWVVDRTDGVEAIKCDELKIRVAFCNVDVACNDFRHPRPRSKKGPGAERVGGGPGLFGDLPQFAQAPKGQWSLYYLMVDENGAAELTRPVIDRGTFSASIERVYLSFGDDDDKAAHPFEPEEPVEDFDPLIVRKK